MPRKFNSLNDSDLDLACGGNARVADALAQTTDFRRRPDVVDSGVNVGNHGGGSASFDDLDQNNEYPDTAL